MHGSNHGKAQHLKPGTGITTRYRRADLGFNEDDVQVDFERSWSNEVGVEHAFSEAIETDITLFHKSSLTSLWRTPISNRTPIRFSSMLEGRVRGLELMLRHNPVGSLFGWVSYTYSKAERAAVPNKTKGVQCHPTPRIGDPSSSTKPTFWWHWQEWDCPRTGVSRVGSIRHRKPLYMYDGAIYDTDQDVYYPYQSGSSFRPAASFIAFDLRADKRYTFKRWWLETYVDLLNVVRGENPESVLNVRLPEETYVRGLPFLPSIGLRAEVAL